MGEHQSSAPLLDAIFDACVKTVENGVNWVKEGGLTDMIEAVAAKASDLTHAVAERAQDFSPFANKSSEPDIAPVKQLAISAPEVTPISHNIAAQVASAGINVASIKMAHVSEAEYVSPPATPAQTVARSNDIGLG